MPGTRAALATGLIGLAGWALAPVGHAETGRPGRLVVHTTPGPPGRGFAVTLRAATGAETGTARLCVLAHGARSRSCRPLALPAPGSSRTVRVAQRRLGRYRIELDLPSGRQLVRSATVRRAGGRFRVLAAGDSEMQILDDLLGDRLRGLGGRVTGDAHISTGLTVPGRLDWPSHARSITRSLAQDVTVMFMGANDGFSLPGKGGGTAYCCDGAWADRYADRVAGLMRTFLRDGRGRVYWVLLPAPKSAAGVRVFRGVNAGIVKAASRFSGADVRLIDLRKRFTPGGVYRTTVRDGGREVLVRQPDGYHLNAAGDRIVARMIAGALRADGY